MYNQMAIKKCIYVGSLDDRDSIGRIDGIRGCLFDRASFLEENKELTKEQNQRLVLQPLGSVFSIFT